MALAGRAARRSWDDQGRPVQPEVTEAFDRDHSARADGGGNGSSKVRESGGNG
jgi:hypothetical protein